MWISDLEAESKEMLAIKLIQGFPLNKIFGQPSISVPLREAIQELRGTDCNPFCGRHGDDLNLAFSVRRGEGDPRTHVQSHDRVWKRWIR